MHKIKAFSGGWGKQFRGIDTSKQVKKYSRGHLKYIRLVGVCFPNGGVISKTLNFD